MCGALGTGHARSFFRSSRQQMQFKRTLMRNVNTMTTAFLQTSADILTGKPRHGVAIFENGKYLQRGSFGGDAGSGTDDP